MKSIILMIKSISLITGFLVVLFLNNLNAKSEPLVMTAPIYWIGGSGDWDDPNHWSKTSGGSPLGAIPTQNSNAIFDSNSGLSNGSTVTVSVGNYDVNDILVFTSAAFTLVFDGSSGNLVSMNIFRDLTLSTNMNVVFNSTSISHNELNFTSSAVHNITSFGHDLVNVKFLDENGTYNLMDDLTASTRIRHYGGEWNTNNHTVNSGFLYFRDSNPTNNPLTKVMNAGTSSIYCDEWDSKLTYGSFTITGTYNVYVEKFIGSPKQGNGISFIYHNIHLLEQSDTPPSGTSIIEHNNFECTECIINKINIEDTGMTKLAGKFTVSNELKVNNLGSTIAFNGGNGRLDEVIINGSIIVPNIQGCDERTIFTNIHNDFTTFIRNTGTLNVENSSLNNIHTQGSAQFKVYNSVLKGSSTGWVENDIPAPTYYVWVGSGSVGDWTDPDNWDVDGGEDLGCIPTIVDNIVINSSAISDISIPAGYSAECNDLIWKNSAGLELTLQGTSPNQSSLNIAGDFSVHPSAIITPTAQNDIIFASSKSNFITTNNVQLPDVRFVGTNAEWKLKDKLNADRIFFESGTLRTQSYDIETDYWGSLGTESKIFYFESSNIKVNGEFLLAQYTYSNVTVNEGTSQYECEKLTSAVSNMYDLKLNNTSTLTLNNYAYEMHDLILNSSNLVRTEHDIELNSLIFNVNNSKLDIDPTTTFTILGGIESNTSAMNPGLLHSRTSGTQADITKPSKNICVSGYVSFLDINADLPGVFHAPLGTDEGNNSNINFDSGSQSIPLYWIGGDGLWSTMSNWSRVSGGCPAIKNPDDALELIFDNNGVFSGGSTISVNGVHSTNKMTFMNTNNAIIDIASSLSVNGLIVDNAYVTLQDNVMTVSNDVTVQNDGLLIIDLLNMIVGGIMTTTSGVVVVKQGSTVNF